MENLQVVSIFPLHLLASESGKGELLQQNTLEKLKEKAIIYALPTANFIKENVTLFSEL